jgi:hypothetical protein
MAQSMLAALVATLVGVTTYLAFPSFGSNLFAPFGLSPENFRILFTSGIALPVYLVISRYPSKEREEAALLRAEMA